MAKVWLQAVNIVHISEAGRLVQVQPGDWFETGKHQARLLLARGDAIIPKVGTRLEVQGLAHCGVVIRADDEISLQCFGNLAEYLRFEYGPPAVPFEYTMIWKPPAPVSRQAAEMGLARLQDFEGEEGGEPWEMLAMLVGEDKIARHAGSEAERARTLQAIGDLRLPVYDTSLLWVRRTEATERAIAAWAAELVEGADEQHAFLRALYGEPIMICALSPNWHVKYGQWR